MKTLKSYSKHASVSVCLAVAALSVLGLAVHGCGARTDDAGNQVSTETGNPPVIDDTRIRVELVDGDVHVVGKAGAVTPGGSAITITNERTDAKTAVTAAKDGSFDAAVSGKLDDEYKLSSGKGSQAVVVSAAIETAPDSGNAPGAPTCDEICARYGTDCSSKSKGCTGECERDRENAASCGQADEWQAMMQCCAEMSLEGADVASCDFDTCQGGGACGALRPSGAADGCFPPMIQPDCAALEQEVEDGLSNLLLVVDNSCETAEDCTTPTLELGCISRCLGPLARKLEPKLKSDVARLSACQAFNDEECQLSTQPGCGTLAIPVACIENQCVVAPR